MDRNDETMNLDDLKDLLADVPASDEFDLDSIIAEISGGTAAAPSPAPARPAAPAAPRPAAPAASRPAAQAVPAQTAPRPARKAAPVPPAPAASADADTADEEDPRAARIAAREAKSAARREKAEARAAARSARTAAEQAVSEDGAASTGRTSRKQARAARMAAEMAEEEQEIELRDPTQAQRSLARRARGLNVRSLFVLVLAAAAAYISLAPGFEALPLPIVLDVVENPTLGIGALLLLQFLAIFLAVDIFGMGFYNLLHGKPDRATLVSVTVLAALLHGASIIVFDNQTGTNIPYLAVSILLLYAAMREERGRYAARARAYKAICTAQQPMAVYSHYDAQEDVCRAVKGPLAKTEDFLTEMERPDTVDRFSMIYAPLALAAAIIFSLIASVGIGEPIRFFWAFSAILSVSAPLGLLCAFGAGYKNISGRLLSLGAALAGARQAGLLRGTEEVVLAESDLFPAGSITVEQLQNLGHVADDKLLGATAAITYAAGLELGRVLTETARDRFGTVLAARNVQVSEGGVAGEVGGIRVIVGTAALMIKLGVRMRASQTGQESCQVYIVFGDTLAGVLTLRYQPTKNTYQAMRVMRRMHMNAALAVTDFNISPAMVESQFDLRRGFADLPEPDMVAKLLDPSYTAGDAPAAILTREGAGPLVQVLRCADKLGGATRSNLTLGTFAGLFGMLIVFYLVFIGAVSALPVLHLLLYVLIWYVPAFFITMQTH